MTQTMRFVRLVGAGVGTAGVIASTALLMNAHGGDPTLIHSCVNSKGTLKIISAAGVCPAGTTPLDWSIQGPTGPQGPQGPAGPQGPPGTPAPTGDLGRVGFVETGPWVTVLGENPPPTDILVLNLIPGGAPGDAAFVKLDATIQVTSSKASSSFAFWLIHDGSGATSRQQTLSIEPYFGTSASVTWVIPVTVGGTDTFRLQMSHTQDNPACVQFNSCARYTIQGAVSAITAPYGASGGKTLN